MKARPMPKTDRLPGALYTARQVRELDRQAIERFGIPGVELMERAGSAAFALLQERWPTARHVCVLAGTGNNGGDGFVLARAASAAGLQVVVLQLGDRDTMAAEARVHARAWGDAGGEWRPFDAIPEGCDVIVDAILGTGLQRELRGQYRAAVEAVNAHPAPVLSLDIPTGLDSDRGVILGDAVHAQATLSFVALKRGMFTADAVDCCGEIRFDALEIPAAVYASQILDTRRMDWTQQASRLSPRRRSAHKGHFGHVLVLGGEHGYGGAALLAGRAAARGGAGRVSIATRKRHVPGVLAACPELMTHAVKHARQVQALAQDASVLLAGPGLGRKQWGRKLFEQVLKSERPLVLDADALNLLAEHDGVSREDWVLTPHPGEAARLLRTCVAEIHADRFAAVEQLQRRYGGSVVLKGAGTLVAGPGNRRPGLCSQGNPGMASGGMGDVLGGVIAAYIAQGWSPAEAAELGVCLHAAAADRAVRVQGERGLLASDLLTHLRRLGNPA